MRSRALIVVIAGTLGALAAPRGAAAGLLDFLFGNPNRQPQQQASQPGFFNPFGDAPSQPAQPLPPIGQAGDGGAYAHCVRMCDGRYFPILARSGTPPAQLCQSFCPASATRVFFGSNIDSAVAANGERYSEAENAYAYRKRLNSDCTCNGRDPTGLAPVDISLDTTLRPGDVVATASGLVAYSGGRANYGQTADFTPVANYPGLTASIRAQLGEMKVSPVSADVADDNAMTTATIPAAVKSSKHGAAKRRQHLSQRDATPVD